MVIVFALLIGIVAGLRAFTAPAAVSIAARYWHLGVAGTPFAFLGYRWTAWIFVAIALAELVGDQLPATPSRKVPLQFGTRILMGALAGGAIGGAATMFYAGLAAGVAGAVIGTFGGAAARAKLAAVFRNDRPAALIEDVVAIGGAWLIVCAAMCVAI